MARNETKAPAQDVQEAPEGAVQDVQEGAAQEAPQEAPQGTVTPEDVARALGITPKAFRSWWRTQARAAGAADTLPGKGRRYGWTRDEAALIVGLYGERKARAASSGGLGAVLALHGLEAPKAPAQD